MSELREHHGGVVVLYQSPDGEVRLEVRLEHDTVWLTQRQMAELFDTSSNNISLHLGNVYDEGELVEEATAKDSLVVRTEGDRQVRRSLRHYNLDAVISVGYRVNSVRGTQFRIWATGTLRDHLLRGYTLNERRLREKGLGEMEQAVSLLAHTLTRHVLVSEEGGAVLDIVRRYASSWRLLVEFDEGRLPGAPARPQAALAPLTLASARSGLLGTDTWIPTGNEVPVNNRPGMTLRDVAPRPVCQGGRPALPSATMLDGEGGRMRYRIAIHRSDEGYSVSVPGLPGCWSQGATDAEAVESIKDAIREYLAVVDEQLRGEEIREIDVAV